MELARPGMGWPAERTRKDWPIAGGNAWRLEAPLGTLSPIPPRERRVGNALQNGMWDCRAKTQRTHRRKEEIRLRFFFASFASLRLLRKSVKYLTDIILRGAASRSPWPRTAPP